MNVQRRFPLQAVAIAALMVAGPAWAQTAPPASGPNGRDSESAPSPSATSTSPGVGSDPLPNARGANGPAPEARATAPGTSAVPQGMRANTFGVPARVVSPDAPDVLRERIDSTTAIAPESTERVRRPSGGVPTNLDVPGPNAEVPPGTPLTAPVRVAPASDAGR